MSSSESPPPDSAQGPRLDPKTRIALVILAVPLGWTWLYNLVIKDLGPVAAFFKVLDTLSVDLVMGAGITIIVGFGIVVVFTLTKLYTQIIAHNSSFRILELLFADVLAQGRFREFGTRLLNFQEEPEPDCAHPTRGASVLLASAFLYLVSWLYLVLFSEALFFVSWSAGVDLPINDQNLQLLPTLALAIPFSARVMAWLRYPYAQDYADFMPGAVFVLLLVASLGYLFQSHDQKFFLLQVWDNPDYLSAFLRNGLLLAFIPVFTEALYWLIDLDTFSGD